MVRLMPNIQSASMDVVFVFLALFSGQHSFAAPQPVAGSGSSAGSNYWQQNIPSSPSKEYQANASKILWEQFQRKNENPSLSNDLPDSRRQYPSSRKFPHIVGMEDYKEPTFNSQLGGKRRRRKNRRKKTDMSGDAPSFSIHFPPMNEQPFNPRHVPTDQEMLQTLKLKNYNTDFMRIVQPSEAADYPAGKLYIPRRNRHSSDSIRQMMRRYTRLPYGHHLKIEMNRRLKRKLRRFIATYTLCPVRYTWRHVGPRFWPRWIKEGTCANLGTSCSLPAGMTCQEGKYQKIGVLRYLCLKGWETARCGWRRVSLAILKDCQCGCRKR